MPEVSLEMLQALMQKMLNETGDLKGLVLALTEQQRRLERRIGDVDRRLGEVRDDIEVMLKAELMGRMGHFETRIEARLEAIEARLPQ
jgi:hypothetical protein